MLSVTVRQLEYAVAAAGHGGVTAAAAALHVSQPSLSVAIGQLEAQLGRPLFVRHKGGPLAPTPFGREFLDEAARLLAALGRLVDPDAPPEGQRLPVTIGCFEDLAPMLLAPVLARLREEHPGVAVATRVGSFESLLGDLAAGRLDFAITWDLGLDRAFLRREMARLRPHAVVAKGHPLAAQGRASLAELVREPLVLADQGLSIRHMIDLFRQRGLEPRIAQRAPTLETMRSMVGNGFGAGLSYTRPRSRESYDGRPLVELEISDDLAGEPVVLVASRASPPSRPGTLLLEAVAAMRGLLRAG